MLTIQGMDAIGGLIDLLTSTDAEIVSPALVGAITLALSILKGMHHLIWHMEINPISPDPESPLPKSVKRPITRASNRRYRRRMISRAIGTLSAAVFVLSTAGYVAGMWIGHTKLALVATEWAIIGSELFVIGLCYSIIHEKIITWRMSRKQPLGGKPPR